jgi:hypothetical protein
VKGKYLCQALITRKLPDLNLKPLFLFLIQIVTKLKLKKYLEILYKENTIQKQDFELNPKTSLTLKKKSIP